MESYLPLGVMRVGSLVTALESVICFLRIGFVLIKHVSICSFINPANENVWLVGQLLASPNLTRSSPLESRAPDILNFWGHTNWKPQVTVAWGPSSTSMAPFIWLKVPLDGWLARRLEAFWEDWVLTWTKPKLHPKGDGILEPMENGLRIHQFSCISPWVNYNLSI